MRHHHVTNGLRRPYLDLRAQPSPIRETSTGIRYQNAIAANDETDVGDAATIPLRGFLVWSFSDEDAIANILHARRPGGLATVGEAAKAKSESHGFTAREAHPVTGLSNMTGRSDLVPRHGKQ
jgi:hypothetical protein